MASFGDGLAAPPLQEKVTSKPTLGRLELVVGQVHVTDQKETTAHRRRFNAPLFQESVVVTGVKSLGLIRMENGHVLYLGPQTRMRFSRQGESWQAYLGQGRITLFALPRLGGPRPEWTIQTAQGWLSISIGKVALTVGKGSTRLLVFDHKAAWRGNQKEGTTRLQAGRWLYSGVRGVRLGNIKRGIEARTTSANNPEGPAVRQAVAWFKEKKLGLSWSVFRRVQKSFPYNGTAAYYLGLIQLSRGNENAAIRQWQHFSEIDPRGAKEKKIAKHLTLLISKRLHREIRQTLEQEQTLANSPPEPNSVAVPPFQNTGSEKYRILAKGLSAMIIADLSKVPGLKVLERAKMQKLMDELTLSKSGLVSNQSRLRAGRLLKAEKIVLGDYEINNP